MIDDFINKEFILCDLVDRKKSVIYKDIDLDKLLEDEVEIKFVDETIVDNV